MYAQLIKLWHCLCFIKLGFFILLEMFLWGSTWQQTIFQLSHLVLLWKSYREHLKCYFLLFFPFSLPFPFLLIPAGKKVAITKRRREQSFGRLAGKMSQKIEMKITWSQQHTAANFPKFHSLKNHGSWIWDIFCKLTQLRYLGSKMFALWWTVLSS